MPAYTRKLSREDAARGRMLIDQQRWGMFPRPGGSLAADVGGARARLRVVGDACACKPRCGAPEHEHRYLQMGPSRRRIVFVAGASVTVDRANGIYRVRNGR
jgi:hypothetical protein